MRQQEISKRILWIWGLRIGQKNYEKEAILCWTKFGEKLKLTILCEKKKKNPNDPKFSFNQNIGFFKLKWCSLNYYFLFVAKIMANLWTSMW